jgi:hypothetical protein
MWICSPQNRPILNNIIDEFVSIIRKINQVSITVLNKKGLLLNETALF